MPAGAGTRAVGGRALGRGPGPASGRLRPANSRCPAALLHSGAPPRLRASTAGPGPAATPRRPAPLLAAGRGRGRRGRSGGLAGVAGRGLTKHQRRRPSALAGPAWPGGEGPKPGDGVGGQGPSGGGGLYQRAGGAEGGYCTAGGGGDRLPGGADTSRGAGPERKCTAGALAPAPGTAWG